MSSQGQLKMKCSLAAQGPQKKLHLGGEISTKKVHYWTCSVCIIDYGPKCILRGEIHY